MDSVGFIYVWYDRFRKMLYIGSHYGQLNDGYICSSKRMKAAYRRRPSDFIRRIVHVQPDANRTNLYLIESRWLELIPDDQLGKKFYNLSKQAGGGWKKGKPKSPEMKEKLRQYRLGRKWSDESKAKMSASHRASGYQHSDEVKAKIAAYNATPEAREKARQGGIKGANRRWNPE